MNELSTYCSSHFTLIMKKSSSFLNYLYADFFYDNSNYFVSRQSHLLTISSFLNTSKQLCLREDFDVEELVRQPITRPLMGLFD